MLAPRLQLVRDPELEEVSPDSCLTKTEITSICCFKSLSFVVIRYVANRSLIVWILAGAGETDWGIEGPTR